MIVGLLPLERVELVSTAHSLALGEEPQWDGVVEVAGVEIAFAEVADVIGHTADAAPIMTAAEIPEVMAYAAAVSRVDPTGPDPLDGMRRTLNDIADELSVAHRLRAEMNARVASARANVDSDAFDRLDRTDNELRRAADQAGRPDPWTGVSDVDERTVHLEKVISDLDEYLSNLPSGDRVGLAADAATAKVALSEGDAHLPRAARLLETWRVHESRRRSIVARFRSLGIDRDGALARLESVRAALCAAEESATPREITDEEAAEIERVHDCYQDHRERVSASLRKGVARRRMHEAQTELTAILESLGYATWSQFRLGNAMVQVSEESLRSYEVTRTELDAAELEWAELTTRLETDAELREIDAAMIELRVEVARLLGTDPLQPADPAGDRRLRKALADVMIDASSSPLDPDETTARLRLTLSECGPSGHHELESRRGVLALAESWLAVLRDADAARLRLIHDRHRATVELEALRAPENATRVDHLDDQRRAVRDAEMAVKDSVAAMRALVEARIELHVLAATELAMAEDHDAKAVIIDRAEQTRLAVRSAGSGAAGGPLPIVILAGGEEPSCLDPLLTLPDDVQVIIVGDGDPMLRWAHSVGSDRASVVDRGVLV